MNNKRKSKIIGIDLGTSNSACAVMEGANPKILVNSEGLKLTPSIIAYTHSKELVVGQIAKRQASLNPLNTFSSIKRFIGRKYDEVLPEIKNVTYKINKDSNNRIRIFCPILQKEFSPEELSAEILKKIKIEASTSLNCQISKAVITVPAYFNDSQRQATKDAGLIAGLEVIRILNEPTAAALAYGLNQNKTLDQTQQKKKKKNEIVLVFDLGGGTLDVSILEVGKDVFEVLATSGDTHLGGDDFDQCIVNYIVSKFKEQHNINLYNDKPALLRILEAAEQAKIDLSTMQSTIINIPFIYAREKEILRGKEILIEKDLLNIDLKLDRSIFEDITKSLIERCAEPIFLSLKDANLCKSDIDQILLVGGSTRIPSIRNLLTNLLKKPLNETVNPDEAVALGAAIQAGMFAGEITDVVLLDVTPLSLGVEVERGLMVPVIPRNTSIPTHKEEFFTTSEDNQEIVDIHVLQGEKQFAEDNRSLGLFKLEGIPLLPRGIPRIKVSFILDMNGILSVDAKEEESGQEQRITIKNASILSNEEIKKLL